MKESHRKDLASHPDPESCVGAREDAVEALTGAHAGQPLSCEIPQSGTPMLFSEAEGCTGSSATASSDPGPAQSKTLRMRGNSLHGNREILPAPAGDGPAGRSGKALGLTPDMYASRKSDGCVVPEKPPNNAGLPPAAEVVEGRRPTEGNTESTAASRTLSRLDASIARLRVREAASLQRQTPEVRAVCGNAARTDLCGGPAVMPVPTATA
jgi:RNA-directed DNA polymerase